MIVCQASIDRTESLSFGPAKFSGTPALLQRLHDWLVQSKCSPYNCVFLKDKIIDSAQEFNYSKWIWQMLRISDRAEPDCYVITSVMYALQTI